MLRASYVHRHLGLHTVARLTAAHSRLASRHIVSAAQTQASPPISAPYMGRGAEGAEAVVSSSGVIEAVAETEQRPIRFNPRSDKFAAQRFHHVEFWTPDATGAAKRFSWGLGMPMVAKSDLSTQNSTFASYVLQSGELTFALTAPYSRARRREGSTPPLPWYDQDFAYDFLNRHGLAVRAIGLDLPNPLLGSSSSATACTCSHLAVRSLDTGIRVEDARHAFEVSTANGAQGVLPPTELQDSASSTTAVVSEIRAYGDCVLRFISGDFQGPYMPNFEATVSEQESYGLQRLDHAVGNVHVMADTVSYLQRATGFHQFAEFTTEDVGTVDSGLNSQVLASNNEMVILPVNEPTFGTPRKSQIQTYLEQNEGPGLQHLALKSNDIVATLRKMRRVSACGGFDFMPPLDKTYYQKLPAKIGDALTPQQYQEIEELGILADKDDQGILLQIFSKPLSDRPTVFIEIIQRIGCEHEVVGADGRPHMEQAGGCGGFGKGNFTALFKSIEEYERTLDI